MNEWFCTVDTFSETYEYVVRAEDAFDAEEEAVSLAIEAGMDDYRWYDVTVREY